MSEEAQAVDTAPTESVDTAPQMSVVGDDGNFSQDWIQGLPDEMGNHSIWQKYGNPLDLAKGAINAQNMVGKKAEEFWTSEAEEDVARQMQIMGIPESPESYNLTVNAPEGIEVDDDRVNAFKQLAWDMGINEDQANALIEWEVNKMSEDVKAFEGDDLMAMQNAEQELREIWPGDKYDYNLAKVQETLDFLGLAEFADDPSFGNNTALIQAFYEKVVPLIDQDEIIENRAIDNYASISDQLSELEYKMENYNGNMAASEYQSMIAIREELLKKIT